MDRETIKRARDLTRRQLGSALADKATDDFCVDYAYRPAARAASVRAEAVAAAGPEGQRAVIELRPSAEKTPGAKEAIGGATAAVSAARDRFYRELGGLRDDVERATATVSSTTTAPPRLGISAAPVQACWLNRTIRAETHASVLGDVAAHAAVERIDVPRRIERETVDVTIAQVATLRATQELTGAGVTVGVIDSEVQLGHPALQDRVVHRRNYTQEPFGTPDSHGTAVAGIIAGRSDGFTGMAPEALIYNYKVLATSSALGGDDFEAALAIQHALEDGVRVVNCSWGAGPATNGRGREARACDEAWRLGLTIVKSAGNRGPGARTLTTPADAEGVLVVGASDTPGRKVPDYSSRGPAGNGRRRPHVVAPGGDFGAEIDGILLGGATGNLGEVGTSFAAPHVTGLVALLIAREPELTPDEQRDRIVATCRALSGVGRNLQGAGLVQPGKLFG